MKRYPLALRTLVLLTAIHGCLGTAFADVRDGLVSYWPLDATDGAITSDVLGGNDLLLYNGPTLVAGHFGNAFSFDGTSQYLSLTHSTDNTVTGLPIYSAADGYTISFWVKGAAQTAKMVFSEGNTGTTTPILLLQTGQQAANNRKFDLYIRTGSNAQIVNHAQSTAAVFDNTWHHVALTDNHATALIYIDGILDTTVNYAPGTLVLNTTSIGALVRNTVGSYFAGAIDDVALWQRVLSQAEINQVRTNGINIPAVPVLIQQPVGGTNSLGDRRIFTVSASGVAPLSYQWYQDGTPMAGQNGRKLILNGLTTPGSNSYSVVVANAGGSVTSSPAPLVVVADPPADPAAGIVSYWPLNEILATDPPTTPDVYYSHTDLTLFGTNDSSLTQGQIGNAIAFNPFGFSQGQYATRNGGSPIYNSSNYTIAFWVNGYAGLHNKQVFAEATTDNNYFILGTENADPYGGSLNVKVNPGSLNDRKSTRTVFDNTWHHVVWQDDNGNAKLFIDGVLDETDFTYYRSNAFMQNTAIGALVRGTVTNQFSGAMDELAIWNRRLTYTEIQQIYATGIPEPQVIAPTITAQPLGSTNHVGDRLRLGVTATATSPSYQWFKDGVAVPGETNARYSLAVLPAPAANDYYVVISNIAGVVTSQVAHVVVLANPAPDLATGLWYYWPLDAVSDSSPFTSPDLATGNPFALVNMDASALTPGQHGNALAFDGVQQYARRSGGFPVYPWTNYTVAFWVSGAAGQHNKQVFSEGGTGGNYFLLGTENDALGAGFLDVKINPGTTDRNSTRTVFDSTWHHVAWVDENGAAKLYVDGVPDETDFTYTRVTTNLLLQSTSIGALYRAGAANYFAGAIDDVAIWGRALNPAEVSQLFATGLPTPLPPAPPAIVAQPNDLANGVYATLTASFSVGAVGSALQYQWWGNGVPLSSATNPSATNSTLTLADLQLSDSGSYWVVVSNISGLSVTSRVAQLTVIPYVPATSGDVLKLDFDAAVQPITEPGFASMTLPMSGTNVGPIKVTLSTIGSGITLMDRNRLGNIADNPPLLTQAAIYSDFIYASASTYTDGAGLRVRIEGLAHNTAFGVTIWSFDPVSPQPRISSWTETSSGTPVVIKNLYSFDGSILPTHDYDSTFGGLVTSSPSGVLQIDGVRAAGADGSNPAVFINALRLVANPVIRIASAEITGGNFRLTIEAQYPGQAGHIEQTSDLAAGNWTTATPVAAEIHGPITVVDLPLTAGPAFYRVVSP